MKLRDYDYFCLGYLRRYPSPTEILTKTGPVKTGGQVFVLDHTRWTAAMKETIDGLLHKYLGKKDILKLVDEDYTDMVHRAATNPNS